MLPPGGVAATEAHRGPGLPVAAAAAQVARHRDWEGWSGSPDGHEGDAVAREDGQCSTEGWPGHGIPAQSAAYIAGSILVQIGGGRPG